MSVPTILILVAAVLAVVDIFEARGRSFVGWAVLCLCLALMWSRF